MLSAEKLSIYILAFIHRTLDIWVHSIYECFVPWNSRTEGDTSASAGGASSPRGPPLHILAGVLGDGAGVHVPTQAACHASEGHVQTAVLSQRQAYAYSQMVSTTIINKWKNSLSHF